MKLNKIDRPNMTPTVRGICTFAVYFSVFRPFCRLTASLFMRGISYYIQDLAISLSCNLLVVLSNTVPVNGLV